MSLSLLLMVASFVFGLLMGSFLNVCITRLPLDESVVGGRSMCRSCAATIHWYDNIPLLSWALLRGRCRHCGVSISWRYPAVELAVGLWFAIAAWGFSSILAAISFAALGFLLIGLTVIDWQTHLLPDAMTWLGIFVGFFLACVHALFLQPGEGEIHLHRKVNLNAAGAGKSTGDMFVTGPESVVMGRLLAIVGAALLLLTIRWVYKALRKREGMGMGDVKLLAMVAAFLGWWPAVLTLFLGTILASGYSLFLLARGKADSLTRLPFGSFLGIGGMAAAIFGQDILNWYAGLLR